MFVVITQILENYGAHCEDGRSASGNAYWKFKSGETYLVEDLDRAQDAMAYVAAAFTTNSIDLKEFPTTVMTWDEYYDTIRDDDADYQNFQLDQIKVVSPSSPGEVESFPDSVWDQRAVQKDVLDQWRLCETV